jgi:hypothetical protein
MFKRGDICYILESNSNIIQAKIVNKQGKFYIVQLIGSCGAIRLSEHRLFATELEAAQSVMSGRAQPSGSDSVENPVIPDVFAGRRVNRSPYDYEDEVRKRR